MILRTITRHVREQNWFAITIDFFIVVLGEIDAASSLLDLGLQATLRNLRATLVYIAPSTLSEFYDNLRVANAIGPKNYGNCFVPITLPNVDLTPFAMVTNS